MLMVYDLIDKQYARKRIVGSREILLVPHDLGFIQT